MFECTLLVSVQNVVLLFQTRLQAARLAIPYRAVQRENNHLWKHKVLEILDA